MTPSVPEGEVRPLGDRAFLIGVAGASAARALAWQLAPALEGTAEVIGGAATVMVQLTDPAATVAGVRARVDAVAPAPGASPPSRSDGPGRLVTIPCRFDGPDLDEVAALVGCAAEHVVALLTAQPLTAAVVGFSPGFAYLDGLPAPLRRVPRRARPRPVVPAGSVALANGNAAVYPTASPGGWHLLGRTAYRLFSPAAPPYAVLAPGDRVQFRRAEEGEPVEPDAVAPPPWSAPAGARRVAEVVAPGLRAVLQDGGRRGVAAAGVPWAGPADPLSFALANRLVGNAAGAATLEVTGGGTRLRCLDACHVGVVGAAPALRVDGTAVAPGQVFPLGPGQTLEIGRQHGGCRSYVAVAGGLLGPAWFASSATDELTGLGPGALAAGDTLLAGAWSPPLGDHVVAGAGTVVVDGSAEVALRVVPGPHAERFAPGALAHLAGTLFVAQPDSNRVGLRLRADGDVALLGDVGAQGGLDSQGVVTGAVQVPPDGDPVVLGPDHATLGGYPVLAVVIAADHGLLGQCAPGRRVRLVPVTPDEAEEAWRAQGRARDGAVVGTFPLAAG